ncbi:hypothetical protein [Chitinophaga lutea]|uniref:hypothetical protein n=1 Tax=Chitinophaga lutea TaxID=2488634 RepID=UPI001315157D|nr:hypothetical protein [Chitinophaga lutea]
MSVKAHFFKGFSSNSLRHLHGGAGFPDSSGEDGLIRVNMEVVAAGFRDDECYRFGLA